MLDIFIIFCYDHFLKKGRAMKKILVFAFLIVQLISFQLDVFSLEITENKEETRIEYASGWTGAGIASDIKAKLDLLEKKAKKRE